jgi:cytochrome c peroxidase
MANIPEGPYPPANGGYSPLLVQKLANRPYTPLFKQVYGQDAFQVFSPKQIYELFGEAIAAYESSGELCAFSSKYDASKYGTPPKNLYILMASEERGRRLFFGQAQCSACHSSAAVPAIQATTGGKDTFTMYCYANIGIPKNIANPYYQQTDKDADPHGYNPLGTNYLDYGLGANPNPAPDGTRFYEKVPGDIPQFRGLFKTPSLRSVDKRPSPDFVKAYMHNGVFKSLKDVVHFYNKRNIAGTPVVRRQPSIFARVPHLVTLLYSRHQRSLTMSRTSPGCRLPRQLPRRSRTARSATFSCPNSRKRI